jgi:hypothetical protein
VEQKILIDGFNCIFTGQRTTTAKEEVGNISPLCYYHCVVVGIAGAGIFVEGKCRTKSTQ